MLGPRSTSGRAQLLELSLTFCWWGASRTSTTPGRVRRSNQVGEYVQYQRCLPLLCLTDISPNAVFPSPPLSFLFPGRGDPKALLDLGVAAKPKLLPVVIAFVPDFLGYFLVSGPSGTMARGPAANRRALARPKLGSSAALRITGLRALFMR